MLSKTHIRTINRVRQLLKHYEYRAASEHGYAEGKFAEACKAAEDALANVLVIARAWLGTEMSDEDLYLKGEEDWLNDEGS